MLNITVEFQETPNLITGISGTPVPDIKIMFLQPVLPISAVKNKKSCKKFNTGDF